VKDFIAQVQSAFASGESLTLSSGSLKVARKDGNNFFFINVVNINGNYNIVGNNNRLLYE
jgi:hypothetical protein